MKKFTKKRTPSLGKARQKGKKKVPEVQRMCIWQRGYNLNN